MDNKKERRTFDKEFKKEGACFITEKGRSLSEIARDLDIHPNVIHHFFQTPKSGVRSYLVKKYQGETFKR